MSMTIPSQKANRKEATEILLQLDEKRVEQFLLSRNDLIPVSIFSKKLSCFEALCKYLHENKQQSIRQIATKLGKSYRNIWLTYSHASQKTPSTIKPKSSSLYIPLSVIKKQDSVLTAVTVFLKERHHLSFKEIGQLLGRSNKTLWTVYNRARRSSK